MNVLDIGCGNKPKGDATVLMDRGFEEEVRWRYSDLEFVEQNLEKVPFLPFDDYKFDKIYLWGILEHLRPETVAVLLKECYRCLKYKGEVDIMVPNGFYIIQRATYFAGIMPSDFVLCHLQHYSFKHMENLLYSCGFKVGLKENIRFYLPFKFLWKNILVIGSKTE